MVTCAFAANDRNSRVAGIRFQQQYVFEKARHRIGFPQTDPGATAACQQLLFT